MEIQKKKGILFKLRVGDSPYIKENKQTNKQKNKKKQKKQQQPISKKQQYNYKENKIIRL